MPGAPNTGIDNEWYSHLGDEWWDPSSRKLAALRSVNRARLAYFKQVLGPLKGMQILDVGCGGGLVAQELAAAGASVSGVDLWLSSVDIARKLALETGQQINYLVGRAEEIPFNSLSFDAVIAADLFEHVSDHLDVVLSELTRVLRHGGKVCYDTPNRTLLSRIGLIWLMEDLLRLVPRRAHRWNMFIRPNELAMAFERQGIKTADAKGLSPKSNLVSALARLILTGEPGPFRVTNNLAISYVGYGIKM